MMNSEVYNIVSENELSEVIAHFNTEFVMSIVDNAIASRFNPSFYFSNPNVVDAWNLNFKQICDYYQSQDMTERISTLRADTFKEIITRICNYHSLNFTIEEVDLYTAAHYLYQFFVCNFLQYMDQFFANYIVKETNSIYDSMQLENIRKRKDVSTIYSRKIFENDKLAIIVANIDIVISYICGMDFSFDYIIKNCGITDVDANYILSIVSPQGDFFRDYYTKVIENEFVRPSHLNNIRFAIRNLHSIDNSTFYDLSMDSTDQIDPIV